MIIFPHIHVMSKTFNRSIQPQIQSSLLQPQAMCSIAKKNNMKKIIAILSIAGFLAACEKETTKPTPYTPPTASFKASLAGNQAFVPDTVMVTSEQLIQGGPFMLIISAQKKINADSSTRIQFITEDFTRDNATESKTISLSTSRPAYFLEINDKVNSTRIVHHFSQNGSLSLNKIGADYINGTFHFTYFTFDQYGTKIAEYPIQNGEFKNLRIKRK